MKCYSYDRKVNTVGIVETADADGPGEADPVEPSRETMACEELNRMTGYSGPRGAEWHHFSADGAPLTRQVRPRRASAVGPETEVRDGF